MSGGNTRQFSPTYAYETPPAPRVADKTENQWIT